MPAPVQLPRISWGNPDANSTALLVHGLGSSAALMRRLGDALANAGWHAVAADLRGHGDAPRALDYTVGAYAADLGLAFQIRDDILDVEGDPETAGKRLRKDEAAGKATFVSLLGIEGARARAAELVESARGQLSAYGSAAGNLRLAAGFALDRAA